MGKKTVRKVERKILVCAAEAGNEMVFERSDGSFGGVAAVDVWRSELEVDVLCLHELLECGGCFVVEFLEQWAKAAGAKETVRPLVSGKNFGAAAVFHGFSVNGVAVVVVEYENV